MKDVMLDLETFGQGPNAAIVQIGACYFDRHTGEIGRNYKVNIDLRKGESLHNGIMDADTLYWWMQQSEQARLSVVKEGVSTFDALNGLNGYLSAAEKVWSHSIFDFAITLAAMKRCAIKPNFSFRVSLDIWTVLDLSGIDPKSFQRDGTHHDALDDCFFQVKYVCAALRKIKRLKQTNGFLIITEELLNDPTALASYVRSVAQNRGQITLDVGIG